MSKLRKHDYTMDGSDWDLSLLSLNEAPAEHLAKNPKAKRIDLSQNFFTKLPPSFTSLTHLIELDLSKNRLIELPQDFGNLNKLAKLDLYGNQLKTLPLSFGQLVRLKWLDLKGNPLMPTLAKYAGDCANQKQCQTCALNVTRFMRTEKIRVENEIKQKKEVLRQKQEIDKQLEEKNKKEKEKKKAKNARRTARKAQQRAEDEEEDESDSQQSNSVKKKDSNEGKTSFGRRVFGFIWFLFRFLLFLSSLLLIVFIGIAIGLHLQNGRKLESIEDIKTALNNSLKTVQNYEQFLKETTLLIDNIVKSVKNWRNWRTTFKIFDEKSNPIQK